MTQEQKAFVERVGKLAAADMKKSGVLASLTIAQAILESGWGKSGLTVKGNALFGIKATASWKGKIYSSKTQECYDGRSFTTITAAFRAYDSWEDSVADHSALLTGASRYKAVIGETDYKKACQAIKAAGYATDPQYAEKLIKIIEDYGLTVYDTADTAVIAAIDKLAKLGVINSPDYWKQHYGDTAYVDALLKKAAAVITAAGTRAATVEAGVNALVSAGVITSPDYWKRQTGTVGELVKALGGAVAPKTSGITEAQLRQQVCDIINSWVGAERGSAKHLEILKIYNEHRPLARGYTVKVSDAHCATTTSAAWIKAGISDYTGTECGVEKFIQIAKQKGIWVEDDTHIPQLGDACVYDWQDGENYATTDNTGAGDHIGIVTAVSRVNGTFTVTEGNTNGGKVGKRTMYFNGRYIRGFICPNYAEIAKKLSAAGVKAPAQAAKTETASTYTVVAGDTLSGIALKKLGNAGRWKEIQTLNGLSSTTIYVGQVLKLPT